MKDDTNNTKRAGNARRAATVAPPRHTTTSTADTTSAIGKADIKRSALETWRKLDTVIQNELSLILKGDKEITASTAAAVIKFIEASADLASGPDDLSEKDAQVRHQAMMAKLPTFDDEDDVGD